MTTQKNENKCEKHYVILVVNKRRRRRYRYYISEPEIFFDTLEEAQRIRDNLIEKKKYTPGELKIQTVWKVK